ncbi:hypothetical protein Ddc_10227 [Ditylenchus destructor]|nr:hypothetical protein Ddc_10227 [Ditylenchus destructor]
MIQNSSPKLCPKSGTSFKTSVAMDPEDSEDPKKSSDVKELLQTMQLLAKKLKVQLGMCAAGVILTIAVYFLIWYNSECWVLPFQVSPCQRARPLPLMATDRNTLADAVDEFILALRHQITKLHNAILMNDHKERHKRFNSAKSEIGQLIHRHSVDLFAFGALKREDHRLGEMKEANLGTYSLMFPFSLITLLFSFGVVGAMNCCKLTVVGKHEKSSVEENENSQNARLKHLKRQIPVLYTATFACVTAEVALLLIFFVGHYASGSSPFTSMSSMVGCDCDYLNFTTALESTLNKRFAKLDNAMGSSALELRQSIWQYESEGIHAAIEHYVDLKKHNVDRRTMPGRIAWKVSFEWYLLVPWLAIITLCMYHGAFFAWALEEGSVWRFFKCVRIYTSEIEAQ